MCGFDVNGVRTHVPAAKYFASAKRRNAHLKRLRSVSRAYRKSVVREVKARAAESGGQENNAAAMGARVGNVAASVSPPAMAATPASTR